MQCFLSTFSLSYLILSDIDNDIMLKIPKAALGFKKIWIEGDVFF